MFTAFAASMTLFMSASETSPFLIPIIPWLLILLIWPPAIPVKTVPISHPAISSASSTAFFMEVTVDSMFTTTPFLSPFDGWVPIPMMLRPCSPTSPTIAHIFVVPMSRPTMISSLFLAIYTSFSSDYHLSRICKVYVFRCLSFCRQVIQYSLQPLCLDFILSKPYFDRNIIRQHRNPLAPADNYL